MESAPACRWAPTPWPAAAHWVEAGETQEVRRKVSLFLHRQAHPHKGASLQVLKYAPLIHKEAD